ncbi:MAG TPA: tetratricopeptide repeat protein [Candidatus Binataceae bacterium]|nr:tetratricopeptide repeat protein [Candidatus Binataceae bacterium]
MASVQSSLLPALIFISFALAAPAMAAMGDQGGVLASDFEEESIPAADLTPTPTPTPSPGEMTVTPTASPGATEGGGAPTVEPTPSPTPSLAPTPTPTPLAEPTPLPTPAGEVLPMDLGSIAPAPPVGDAPLDQEISSAPNPARVASLRLTDQARAELLAGRTDDAIRTLGRAMSIDPSDPYPYFYLGRASIAKKDYEQAMTFFKRAEIGFGDNPPWLGETLAFEGLGYEEWGHPLAAEAQYQQALKVSPGNLMARVGYTRTAASNQPAESASPEAAPSESAAPPPPEEAPPPAAPEESAPPAAAPTD